LTRHAKAISLSLARLDTGTHNKDWSLHPTNSSIRDLLSCKETKHMF